MKTIITNKCKDYIFNAESGIKFQIKGYAFLIDNESLIRNVSISDLENLQLKDLYRKNPSSNEEIIVYNPAKSSGGDILDRLFDTTYVPSLEVSTNDGYNFGTYSFNLNPGLDPKKNFGFSCKDYNCEKFDAILIIGQKFSENKTYVEELDRSFLAAIIIDDAGFTVGEDNKVITWQFGLATSAASSVSGINEYYDNIGEFTLKDNQTTELKTTNPLFLVTMSGLNYDEEINSIIQNSTSGDVDYVSGNYLQENIILTDETEKINNLWNVTSTVTVFDRHDSPISKPQLMLSYNDDNNVINSMNFTYDRSKSIFTLNQADGCDNIQVDLFPENLHIENKFCVDPEIKPFNHTTISSWSACSGNRRFFKLNSNGSEYSSANSFDTFELNSNNNILCEINSATTFINSNNNNLVNVKDLTFLNTSNSKIDSETDGTYIGCLNTDVETDRTNLINNHTYIGTNNIRTLLTSFGTTNNVTLIGNNNQTQFVNSFSGYVAQNYRDLAGKRVTAELFNVTDFRHIKGTVNTISADSINVEYNANIFKYTTSYYPNEYLNNDYASLIGFDGLILNKNFYTIPNYTGRTYEGYSKSLNESKWEVEGNSTAMTPNNYTVTFGSYNAYTNPYILYKDGSITSIKSYLSAEYGMTTSSTDVSSVYVRQDGTFTVYDTSSQSAKPFILYFRNHQDSINTRNDWEFYRINSDEGDYSLNKIVVVGGGEQYKENEQMLFTPAENVAKNFGLDSIGKRIDLFSIEQNSFQLVHNNNYDIRPSFSATHVIPIPGMFAVRGWEPVTQKYLYKFSTSSTVGQTPMYQTINKYNLQNAIYTPSSILIPLQRSSNDEYKLGLDNIQDYIKGSTISGVNKKLNYTKLNTDLSNFKDKRQTFVYRTKGIKSQIKGIKGTVNTEWCHKLYIEDVFSGLSKKGINIKSSGLNGINSKVYTIYLVNDNPIHTLTFKGIRLRKVGANYQSLLATRYIAPGTTQRIMYLDNGSNGEYGVMNFDYYNPNNNTYMTR